MIYKIVSELTLPVCLAVVDSIHPFVPEVLLLLLMPLLVRLGIDRAIGAASYNPGGQINC